MTAIAQGFAHLGEDTAGPITEDQHNIYDQIAAGKPTFLISVTEKGTGRQRAVVCGLLGSDADTVDVVPVALILDSDDDLLQFDTPTGAEVVNIRES